MREDYTVWIDHPDVPAADRTRIRELVDDLTAASERGASGIAADLRHQLAACCAGARDYVAAIATWQGEGGR